jgi:hypothetical protein
MTFPTSFWKELSIPLERLDALVEQYLPGLAPGWVDFDREVIVHGGSVVYKLRQGDLGELGTIKLRQVSDDTTVMQVHAPPRPSQRKLTPEEQESLANSSDSEKDQELSVLLRRRRAESEDLHHRRKEHQRKVLQLMFNRMKLDSAWPTTTISIEADKRYSTAGIRALLCAAFTTDTLSRFCYDRPFLRPVYDDFSKAHSLNELVDRVITYCEKKDIFDYLLAEVAKENPQQYEHFESRLYDAEPDRAEGV